MSKDPFAGLAEKAFAEIANPNSLSGAGDFVEPEVPTQYAPRDLGERFDRGLEAGSAGLKSSGQMFNALAASLVGADETAQTAMLRASEHEQDAARALEPMESFQEFYDQPTFEGFLNQAASGIGQAAPSLALTVGAALATGGTSVLVGAAGRGALSASSQIAARRVIKEAAENVAKKTATPDEKEVVSGLYKTLQGMSFKRGAYTGAAASSFVPLSGENFNEGLEAGEEPDAELALRSLLVAVPQTAVDITGEALFLKGFAKLAGAKAAKTNSSIMANLAKETAKASGKGIVTEGFAEAAQETISVANRTQMDDDFAFEDGYMRIGEAAFMGAVAGKAAGAATGFAGGAAQSAKRVFTKAEELSKKAREQRVNDEADREEFGDIDSGNTTQESERDIANQLGAMFDPTSSKEAVWVAGDIQAGFRDAIPEDNTVQKVKIDGAGETYGAYIPGRGVILGEKSIVESVVADGASDNILAAALGYSAGKAADADQVVQAVNRDGEIVSEEGTNEAGLAAAKAAAEGLAGEGGSVRTVPIKDALRERKKRLDAERPKVRKMDVNEEDIGGTEVDEADANVESNEDASSREQRTQEGKEVYAPKTDPEQVFDNTEQSRQEWQEASGQEIDWANPLYAAMPESMLRTAAKLQQNNPTKLVEIYKTEGGYRVESSSTPDTELVRFVDQGVEQELSIGVFLEQTLRVANRSATAPGNIGETTVTVIGKDGKETKALLSELTNAGRRIVEARERSGFTGAGRVQAGRAGLIAILGELQLGEFRVELGGRNLLDMDSRELAQIGKNVKASGGKKQQGDSLGFLLGPRGGKRTEGRNPEGYVEYEPDGDDSPRYRTETEQMQEAGLGDLPLTQQNIELGPVDTSRNQNSGKGGTKRQNGFRQATFPLGNIGTLATTVINRAVHALRLKKPVAVIGVKEFLADPNKLAEAFTDPVVAERVAEIMQELADNPNAAGRYIGFGNAHIVLVDNRGSNQLQNSLVATHELGHALFEEEMFESLNNAQLYKRLYKAFEKAQSDPNGPAAYNDSNPHAFEEWYADQVGIWSQRLYLKQKHQAKNFVERTFKEIAERITKMFKAMSGELRRRFGKEAASQDFQSYMDEVIAVSRRNRDASRSESAARVAKATFKTKLIVRAMEATIAPKGKAQQTVEAFWGKVSELLKSEQGRRLTKWVAAEDNALRAIAPKIADMFYVRSQSGKSGVGFLDAKINARNEILNDLEALIGSDWDTPEVQKAFDEASSDTATADLSGKAKEIRSFLDTLYEEYISKANGNDIQRRENYFPVSLDLASIFESPEAFIELVIEYNPDVSPQYIRETVDALVEKQASIIADDDIVLDASDPLSSVEKARIFTANIPADRLRDFTHSPQETLIKYIRHITIRTEFNRATKREDGSSMFNEELDKLSPSERKEALAVIERYLGYGKPMHPLLSKVSGYAQLFQWVTLLPLVTLSSVSELGGALVASKDFSGVMSSFKSIAHTIQNREESIQLARELGVTVSTAMANLGLTDADDEFLDPKVRKLSDKFFKAVGLDFFTRFTREFASQTGLNFLKSHALKAKSGDTRSIRYLEELGVSAAEVQAWQKSTEGNANFDFSSAEGAKVKAALQRFVSSSMLRPNAAERPAWANDPRFALIWSLKSFLYSFSKVITGGMMREAKVRFNEGETTVDKLSGVGMQMLLAGVAFMPLAMLSLEMKELSKYLLAMVLPGVEANGRYFRSDYMETGEYLSEIFDRAGYAGPAGIIGMIGQTYDWGETGLAPILGPTYGLVVDDILLDGLIRGDGLSILPKRVIPGYNVVM